MPGAPFGAAAMNVDEQQWRRSERRLRRVIEHLHDHLDEPLDLNVMAEIACMSPHHWHRVYQAMFGETLAHTVKRLRLHRAAGELATAPTPIARIATRAGYPNLQSFTRTFKAVYGMPPARYRSAGQHRVFDVSRALPSAPGFELTVRELDALPLLAVEHRGSYMGIGRAFDLLFARLSSAGLARPGMRMLALFFDDPALVLERDLRSQAAVAGYAQANGDDIDLLPTSVPAGPYAVLTHTGPYASMKPAYQWLFSEGLSRSGLDLADGPVVEEYLNSPRETAPRDLRTLICAPLRPASLLETT